MLVIIGIKIIISISNKIKMIKIYIKFIDILIFLLFKLLNPHSILFIEFLFEIDLLMKFKIE